VQAGDFFAEVLWQTIDTNLIRIFVLPQVQLREALLRTNLRAADPFSREMSLYEVSLIAIS